jgi:hypothetical protein
MRAHPSVYHSGRVVETLNANSYPGPGSHFSITGLSDHAALLQGYSQPEAIARRNEPNPEVLSAFQLRESSALRLAACVQNHVPLRMIRNRVWQSVNVNNARGLTERC